MDRSREKDIVHSQLDARGRGIGADELIIVAIRVDIRARAFVSRVDVEGSDAEASKRVQLARIGDAIAVGVDPDPQLAPDRILCVDDAVMVGVIVLKCLKAIHGQDSGLQAGRIAEQLAAVIDLAVVVDVPNQQPVGRRDPTGLFGKAGVVKVEISTVRIAVGRRDAVAVEVENDRAAGRRVAEGGGPGGVGYNAHAEYEAFWTVIYSCWSYCTAPYVPVWQHIYNIYSSTGCSAKS